MRLGVVLEPAPADGTLVSLARQAAACEAAGIGLGWLGSVGDDSDRVASMPAMAAAAGVAAGTAALRLAAAVQVGSHPLRIAEDATIADNCANGRLVLVLIERPGEEDILGESADVVLAAIASRPFSHHGSRWKIPAQLPENQGVQRRLTMTPATAQIEMPLWLGGTGAPGVARPRGLTHLAAAADPAAAVAQAWRETERQLGLGAARLRRPAIRALDASSDGEFDDEQLVASLRSEQDQWGLDVAIMQLPRSLNDEARERVIDGLGRLVAPRVQLDALPTGLEAHWKQTVVRAQLGAEYDQ